MKCQYCKEEINSIDPNYGKSNIHYNCAVNLQNDMNALEMIEIISRSGDIISWKMTESFDDTLNDTIHKIHEHIIPDSTVDDDIIDMLAVLKAVHEYVSDSSFEKNAQYYAQFIFNGLMIKKYGAQIPFEKTFQSRIREYIEEIKKIEITEEEAGHYKDIASKIIPLSRVNGDLDDDLDKSVLQVLNTIEEIALKFEEELEAPSEWRNFRKDEILLQTIRDMIIVQLRTTPSDGKVTLSERDVHQFNNATERIFKEFVRISSGVAKKNNIPLDVILARIIPNLIMNLIGHYISLKTKYAQKGSSKP